MGGSDTAFLDGGGEMTALMRAFDWSSTSLGPLETWPQSLRTATALLLRSPVPIVMLWNEDGVMIYNDAYAGFAGARHPELLGMKVREAWPEVADFNDNVMRVGLGGGTLAYRDQELVLVRTGRPEPAWMNLDYSPVIDESGRPAGVIAIVVETTDRVLAERKLQAERDRLFSLFEQAPGFIVVMRGPQHVVEFVNAAHRAVFGSGDWVGRPLREAFPDIEGQGFFEDLDQVLATGERQVFASQTVRFGASREAEPSDRVLDFVYEPMRDAAGRITGVFCQGYDVTEQRRAQEALRRSEARLSFLDRLGQATAALESADAVLATTTRMVAEHLGLSNCAYADMDPDEDGFTIRGDWAAPGSPSIVGHYSLADFGRLAVQELGAGRPLIINDNLKEIAPEEAATFQAIGISATICMPLVKNGRLTALMAIHDRVPHRWTDEELALITEVTERSWAHVQRVGAEAALRENEERYRTLFETVDAGFCIVEVLLDEAGRPKDYRFLESNPAFERETGLTDAVGRTARELLPDLEQVWIDTYGRVALTGEPARFEMGAETMGRWFDVHALRIGDPEARRVAILFNDISERRRGERELQALNEQLEARVQAEVGQRMQAEEALLQSQKMETIGQLTGGVAHDFNNLLTPIVGALDLLRRRLGDDERALRLTDGALQAAERARILVQRLLAFARRQHLEPRAVDVGALVESMTDLVSRSIGPRIVLRVEVADDMPPALVDPNQLELALLNLAVNARDAMPDGGALTIRAGAAGPPAAAGLAAGRYVSICVADTGHGMDEATLSRAVEPFFTTKGVGRGTGLGLSSVHGLAMQSGGAFVLESRPGEGLKATLWLPAAPAGTTPEAAAEATEAASAPAAGGVLLLVDDEELARAGTAAMLEEAGYRVTQAGGAAHALELMDQGAAFDALLTDYAMPGMTGAELARRTWERRPGTPVLLLTGYASLGDRDAGGLPRLEKPFRQAELADAVAELLKARGQGGGSRE